MTAPEPLPVVERTGVSLLDPRGVPLAALDVLASLAAPPSLAPLLRVEAGDASVSLVHRVPADAVPLESLVAVGHLDVPHAVTVGVAVGSALQALHDAGLAHGGVALDQVLAAPDGSVVLIGAGLAWRAAPGEPDGPRAADDIAALGTLLRGLLGPRSAPAPLVVAALRAVDDDPLLRPSAADLVAAVRRCGYPLPLPLDGSAPRMTAPAVARGSVPRRPSRGADPRAVPAADQTSGARRPWPPRVARRVVVVLLVVTAGALAVRAVPVGLATAEPAAAPTYPAPTAAPAAPTSSAVPPALDPEVTDWAAVLAALDEGRRRALESGSEGELALWVDPAGDAWSHDSGLLRRLASSRATLSGGALVLEDVEPQQVGADRAVLAVRDRRTAYEVVQDGRRTRVPERSAQWWTVMLTALPSLDGEGWRVSEVRSAVDRAAP